MFIKNRLPMLTLFLLLSNVLMQGMNNSLHNAIGRNDYDTFIDLLENKKISPNSLNERDKLPIFDAAMKNDSRFLKKLIEYGANVNVAGTALGRKPIHFACYNNKTIKNIKLLVKAGADIEAKIDGDSTPFFEALYQYIQREDCKEVMKVLIERGANIAFEFNDSPTVLAWAERSLDKESDQKRIAKYTWLKDLAASAPQIRANYLKKKAVKQEEKRKMALRIEGNLLAQQRLVKFNSGTIIKIKNEDINTHLPLLVVRCFSALSLINQ